jgi:hypothetical protein
MRPSLIPVVAVMVIADLPAGTVVIDTSNYYPRRGKPAGSPDRPPCHPCCAEADRKVGISLVEDTGVDAFDAGTLAESWSTRITPCGGSRCGWNVVYGLRRRT